MIWKLVLHILKLDLRLNGSLRILLFDFVSLVLILAMSNFIFRCYIKYGILKIF